MIFDYRKRYDSASEFFELNGSITMKLTADAARAVCRTASKHGLVVFRVEGGIWHNPGFEARLDCIWDGKMPPLNETAAIENNRSAEKFIADEQSIHDVFIVSTTSYRHNATPLSR